MFLRTILASLLAVFATGVVALAQTNTPLSAQESCNFKDSSPIFWEALGQTVTLHTQVKQEGAYLPRATLQIEFSDGKILNLAGGGKYYDDYSPENVPSCAHILAAATNDTIVSLNEDASLWRPELYNKVSPYESLEIKVYRRMSELRVDILLAKNCNPHDADFEQATICQAAQLTAERVLENESYLPKPIFDRLVAKNVPIIMVNGSTYYTVTYAYDSENNTLHELFSDGC